MTNFILQEEPRWPAFRHWLLNIVEQNRSHESFNRVLSRIPESLYNFLVTQWHEQASPEQIDTLVSVIMEHLGIEELPKEIR